MRLFAGTDPPFQYIGLIDQDHALVDLCFHTNRRIFAADAHARKECLILDIIGGAAGVADQSFAGKGKGAAPALAKAAAGEEPSR